MKKTIALIIIFIFFGCSKQNETKIEIYLLKHRVPNKYGISRELYISKHKGHEVIGKHTTADTISKKFIYAGDFDVNSEIIENKPFLESDELLFLDQDKSELSLSISGAQKLDTIKGRYAVNGLQYVITENRKPIMTGYFWCTCSSYGPDWNGILYESEIPKNQESYKLKLFRGKGMGNWIDNKVNFKSYPKLIEAFKKSNKLK